jgi:hypothetical protein
MARAPRRSSDQKTAANEPMPATDEARRAPDDAEMPDNIRRRDAPADAVASEPVIGDDFIIGGRAPTPDGDVDQHPIHDEPMEDLGPEDYEQMADEAAETPGLFDDVDALAEEDEEEEEEEAEEET